MAGMKRSRFLCLAVSVCLLISAAQVVAAPIGNSARGREYVVAARDLDEWAIGAFGHLRQRDAEVDGLVGLHELETLRAAGFVSYGLLPWMTVYGTAGLLDAQLDGNDFEEGDLQLGAGLHFNLLYHDIADPTLMEDRITLTADVEYTFNQSEYLGNDLEWTDFTAYVLLGLVNDISGTRLYLPYSIGAFFGPVFSDLQGDISEDNLFGLMGGLEVFFTRSVSLMAGIDYFDGTGFFGSATIRF